MANCINWDTESINSDIELFRWIKTNSIEGSSIVVDKAGLYTVNIALFVNIAASTLAPTPQNNLNSSQLLNSMSLISPEKHSPPDKSRNLTNITSMAMQGQDLSPICGALYMNGTKLLDLTENQITKPSTAA